MFESWKLGQKGKDNGVLVVVAPKDRKMRIEVGYGLEGTLTDVGGEPHHPQRDDAAFKDERLRRAASTHGVDAIVGQLEGTRDVAELADVPSSSATAAAASRCDFNEPDLPPWPMRILLGAFIFGIIGLFTFIGVDDAGHGLVPLLLPDSVLGDVPDHDRRRARARSILLGIYVVGFPIAKLIVCAHRRGTRRRRRT